MIKIKSFLPLLLVAGFFLCSEVASAASISVKLTVNGKESVTAQYGDVLRIKWKAKASRKIVGCQASGALGAVTLRGEEFVGQQLPVSGTEDLVFVESSSGGVSISILCWLEGWPQNNELGRDMASDDVFLTVVSPSDSSGILAKPYIIMVHPASGNTVGSRVDAATSGVPKGAKAIFIGSPAVASDPYMIASPVFGQTEVVLKKSKTDSNAFSFKIPKKLSLTTSDRKKISNKVIPGTYYIALKAKDGTMSMPYVYQVIDNSLKKQYKAEGWLGY